MRQSTGAGNPTWWQRASKTQTTLGAALVSAVLLIVLIGFDLFSSVYRGFLFPMLIIDAAVSLLFGALVLKILRDAQERHRALLQRIGMIADLHHHIRNALEQIQLSAYTSHDAELMQNVQASVARIE